MRGLNRQYTKAILIKIRYYNRKKTFKSSSLPPSPPPHQKKKTTTTTWRCSSPELSNAQGPGHPTFLALLLQVK